MRRLSSLAPAALAAVLVLAGCGSERKQAVSLSAKPAVDSVQARFPKAGLTVSLPRNVTLIRDVRRPAVFKATLGEPFVSAFAYRRSEQLPRTAAELDAARSRLVRTVPRRQPGYRLVRSGVTEIDGSGAVELVGRQTLSRRRVQVRSLHVFSGTAEYVVEVVAPVGQFARFDSAVTPLIRRTLDVSGTVKRTG
ncbi:MAG: hypothetical protein ACR2HC_04535 [Thermoleophilaceae bacterium]